MLCARAPCREESPENHGPEVEPRDGARVLESCDASRLRLDVLLLLVVPVLVLLVPAVFWSFGRLEFSCASWLLSCNCSCFALKSIKYSEYAL